MPRYEAGVGTFAQYLGSIQSEIDTYGTMSIFLGFSTRGRGQPYGLDVCMMIYARRDNNRHNRRSYHVR